MKTLLPVSLALLVGLSNAGSLLDMCSNPPAEQTELSDKMELLDTYKVIGSVTNWNEGKASLLIETATRKFRVLEIHRKKPHLSQKWIQMSSGDRHIEYIASNGTCDGKAAPPAILKVPRFESIIGSDTSSVSKIVEGVNKFIWNHNGFYVKDDVVDGVKAMKWVSCVNGRNASDTKVLVELRFREDEQFSDMILLSIRLAELKDFNTTTPENHFSIEFDRYEIPRGDEHKAQIAHGIFCENRKEVDPFLEHLKEYAATLSYYNYKNKTSEVVDVLYRKKVLVVAGNSFRNFLKSSNYSVDVDYILHDYNYGYEIAMKTGGCHWFRPIPKTNAVWFDDQDEFFMRKMLHILLDYRLRWMPYQDTEDLAGNTYKAYRALDESEVVELYLTQDGDIHSINRYDRETKEILQSMVVTRWEVSTSKLNLAMAQMAGCYDNGKFTNNTWIFPIKNKNIKDVYSVGLSNLNKAVADTISRNVHPVIPYRVIVRYLETSGDGISLLLRLAERTDVLPAKVGYNYTNELATANLFKKMINVMFAGKMPILVEENGQTEEWLVDISRIKAFPAADTDRHNRHQWLGYTGGAMLVLGVFCFVFGVGLTAGGFVKFGFPGQFFCQSNISRAS
ncbi:hypothetical protein B9Z55_008949 [Caenorhabditis nigoni]|uniref:Uncharacterized protein n=1 Tax=Caenorhabditis nigoni TaxID=1611254 RepID=A0A2G5UPY1_9PELO|nr:hypothetical protein B9Z55_008949 [Caenorhabditis nigoni]